MQADKHKGIHLPPLKKGGTHVTFLDTRQITIIGGNGAGKSRFMAEMTSLAGEKAFILNALSAFFPERQESTLTGSIDDLYRKAIRQQSYMRVDAVSQLDKLVYMLFADELESLLDFKENGMQKGKRLRPTVTKLDIIKRHWEKIFPGNKIMRIKGNLMFATQSGDNLISASALSQGEQTALYYMAAVLYAMPEAVIFIDSPSMFVHPSILGTFWNSVESMRPDCTFVYNSVDEDFVETRINNTCIWVKSYDSLTREWDYKIINPAERSEELMVELAGSRRPVLFIEGDARHSIDMRLYSLVFRDMTVRPLGSCNKVIETTRTFNDLKAMHHLQSYGIVDRDRRSEQEVRYLQNKQIMVPDVAEIENIFLLPEVIRIMAKVRGRDASKIVHRVQRDVIRMFRHHADQQALQHVRHKVKREVECKIDARFSCITALETHLRSLPAQLQPRKHYNRLREEFAVMIRDNDYASILRVFNHKPMLPDSGIHTLLGYHSKEDYIEGVLTLLKGNSKDANALREAVRHILHADELFDKDMTQDINKDK